MSAFLHWYSITLVIPLLLAGIVERVRVNRFGRLFPAGLFSSSESVSRKFHQAALLCLTLGLVMSSPIILNDVYTRWVIIEKLKLNTLFLGFSFPMSLISMSVIFDLMKDDKRWVVSVMKESSFWLVNVGVIVFFLFILAKWYIPQVIISIILFFSVVLVLYLYWHEGIRIQQKTFLTSGIFFLLCTSITGIIYIFLSFSDSYDPLKAQPLLRLHAFTALYGWNLSGFAVISRHGHFPIRLNSKLFIILHWLTVAILCPVGYFYPPVSVVAVASYVWLLKMLFFEGGQPGRTVNTVN